MSKLDFVPALNRPELVSPSIVSTLRRWQGSIPVQEILVAKIDPAFAGGAEFCNCYSIPTSEGANCVIVEATRGDVITMAACVALVGHRIDFNGVVRRTLNARRVSLAPVDDVLKATGMEYGSITPIGLPSSWIILIDEQVAALPRVVIGAGLVSAKLSLPGKALVELPGAIVVNGLAKQK